MSVQLVIYPQFYDGYTQSFSLLSEYVSDGTLFSLLNNNAGYDVPTSSLFPASDAVTAVPAIPAWKRFRSTNPSGQYGNVTMPTQISNKLYLYSNATYTSSSGVYQEIQNLNVGVQYELKINITQAGAGGTLFIGNGLLLSSVNMLGGLVTSISTASTGIQTISFTASNTQEVLLLEYRNNNGSTIHIDSISIKDVINQPSQTYGEVFDGQVICDLYEDEDIPLSLSIDDFKNVAENVQSYSKDFNLPATKRNNKIFSHIFEVTKTYKEIDSFNPYIKTRCILKQDGYDIFQGYLKLLDIVNKEGEISYSVNLFSEPVALKDVLDNRKFRDLDFSELEHNYNRTNIKASWDDSIGITLLNSLSTNSNAYDASLGVNNTTVLKYPFVNWVGDFIKDSVTNNPILGSLEDAFRPFINCKYILKQIFDATQFTYTSNFLDGATFSKMYMDFNWGAGNAPNDIKHLGEAKMNSTPYFVTTTFTNLNFNSNNFSTEFGFDMTTDKFTATSDNTIYQFNTDLYFETIIPSTTTLTEARWIHKDSGGNTLNSPVPSFGSLGNFSGVGFFYVGGIVNITLNAGDTLELQIRASVSSAIKLQQADINGSVTLDKMTNSVLLNTLRGDLGQWEYLKGIMNMFNLVMLQDKNNPNNIVIEPYKDIFINNTAGTTLAARSILHDWTDKIDITEIKLSPLELVKTTIFKYEDDESYPNNLYKNTVEKDYGSKLFSNPDFTLLTGEEEIKATPFAATVIKPLIDYLPDFLIPVVYSSNDDNTEFESFNNKPRILFKISSSPYDLPSNISYYIPAQNGVGDEDATQYLRFSHTTALPSSSTDTDLNYGEIQLINGVGVSPEDNLYNTYWSPYYDELYNPDTRYMTLKVNLNASDINQFNFYDKVMIKNREYRVNKIEYKPNDLSTVEFILIP
jgi:hypothetical protein